MKRTVLVKRCLHLKQPNALSTAHRADFFPSIFRGLWHWSCNGFSPTGPPCETHLLCKEGRCARYAREGERCTAPDSSSLLRNDECQAGLFCDADASQAGTCRKRRAEGDGCRTSALECDHHMGCYPETRGAGWGTCRKRPGLGADCDTSALLADCAPGLTCSQTYGKCLPLAHEGEPCGLLGECAWGSRCSDEGRCLPFEAARCG